MQQYALLTFFVVILLSLYTPACKHEPSLPGGGDPTDTIPDPGDTTGNPGGGNTTGIPCDPDSVYFQNTVLPLLVSNCTESGCHNETDHEDGVVLTSYQSILSTVEGVTRQNWDENDLMEALLEDDADKRMPYGKAPLPQAQINLIATWIQQGAKNNGCNENFGSCETTNVKYGNFVQPLVQSKCQGCHSGAAPQGGIDLSAYARVKALALDGRLYTAVTRSANWMPKGGAKLDNCTTDKLKAWIDAGAPEN